MIPFELALFMGVAGCCATALYVRHITRREAGGVIRAHGVQCQAAIIALSKGIQDEARLRELDALDFLNGVLQQARKHGLVHGHVQKLDEGKPNDQHPPDANAG